MTASTDKSLDQMDPATVVNPTDLIYLVQGGVDKRLTFATLIASWPTTTTTVAPTTTTLAPTTTTLVPTTTTLAPTTTTQP